jgi:hypothetical protein
MQETPLSNESGVSFCRAGGQSRMDIGHFYFLSDSYFVDFPDLKLMRNKEDIAGQTHNRPCFYALQDASTGLFWMIPCSSRIAKYRDVYSRKMLRYGRCDTIAFGEVLGHETAFLLQNMCPVSQKYISNEYMDRQSGLPVRISGTTEEDLLQKAQKVLLLTHKGMRLIFPDVIAIEKTLLANML